SAFSRRQLALHCSIPTGKFRIVSPAADHICHVAPDVSVLERLGLRVGEYALAVGSLHRNKNFGAVEAAASRIGPAPFDLVVVGGEGQPAFRRQEPRSMRVKY